MSTEQIKAKGDIENLLKPRYKVIADYPASEFFVGSIRKEEIFDLGDNEYRYSDFPHLFKPLAWYEDREPDEWPEYVKGLRAVKRLLKVEDHGGMFLSILCEGETVWGTIWMYEPATEEEYLSYLKK